MRTLSLSLFELHSLFCEPNVSSSGRLELGQQPDSHVLDRTINAMRFRRSRPDGPSAREALREFRCSHNDHATKVVRNRVRKGSSATAGSLLGPDRELVEVEDQPCALLEL